MGCGTSKRTRHDSFASSSVSRSFDDDGMNIDTAPHVTHYHHQNGPLSDAQPTSSSPRQSSSVVKHRTHTQQQQQQQQQHASAGSTTDQNSQTTAEIQVPQQSCPPEDPFGPPPVSHHNASTRCYASDTMRDDSAAAVSQLDTPRFGSRSAAPPREAVVAGPTTTSAVTKEDESVSSDGRVGLNDEPLFDLLCVSARSIV